MMGLEDNTLSFSGRVNFFRGELYQDVGLPETSII